LALQTEKLPLAYLPMRVLGLLLPVSLLIVDPAWSQTIDGASQKNALPMFRPALVGTSADSLINQIDRNGLKEKGQGDAAVMFYCVVAKSGKILDSATYRATPDSEPLEQELLARLQKVTFVPAIRDHKPVDAVYYGTATFAIVDGQPRLRIFSNQEYNELDSESDFISPQPYFGSDSKFLGMHYPAKAGSAGVNGMAELDLKVDANGNVKQMALRYEAPPFLGFGDAAIADFKGAKFIPAFRDGHPVESAIILPVYYKAPSK
jgi:TonB family protein